MAVADAIFVSVTVLRSLPCVFLEQEMHSRKRIFGNANDSSAIGMLHIFQCI